MDEPNQPVLRQLSTLIKLSIYLLLLLLCVWRGAHQSSCAAGRGQLCRVGFSFHLLDGFWGLNSGYEVCCKCLYLLSHLTYSTVQYSFIALTRQNKELPS